MRRGELRDFISLFGTRPIAFLYNKQRYECEGIYFDGSRYYCDVYKTNKQGVRIERVYSIGGTTFNECSNHFFNTKLFGGRTIKDMERKITWLDWN